MSQTFSRISRLSRKGSQTPEQALAAEVAAAHESLRRLQTDAIDVLVRLLERELERRVPAPDKLLLRFEIACQPTALIVAKILRTSFPDARTAVDLTPGHGSFWREDMPIHLTVERSPYDFRRLPYADDSYGVALLDPPHNADAGAASIMGTRFGTYKQADLEPAVRQGVREAWRVSSQGMIVKVTDQVHGQRFVRMSGWVFDELGEPYDVVHTVRKRALEDPRWKDPPLSARNNGASYLIFRKDGAVHRRRGKEGERSIDLSAQVRPATRWNQAADSHRSITPLRKADREQPAI